MLLFCHLERSRSTAVFANLTRYVKCYYSVTLSAVEGLPNKKTAFANLINETILLSRPERSRRAPQ